MRSSKSRSRSNKNRNRSVGNIINRVFDSSGPEGKVRGTPQQIIDKYNQLARDSQLSNDRVSTENFQQHAEHYVRLLSEAQREMDARREQQDRENKDRNTDRDKERNSRSSLDNDTSNLSNDNDLNGNDNSLEVEGGERFGELDNADQADKKIEMETPVVTKFAGAAKLSATMIKLIKLTRIFHLLKLLNSLTSKLT